MGGVVNFLWWWMQGSGIFRRKGGKGLGVVSKLFVYMQG